MVFSFDSKFLFTSGGDNIIKQISCISQRVIWSFEFATMAPHTIIPLPTSPRLISVSTTEIFVINFRSKLLEFEDTNPESNWVSAQMTMSKGALLLQNKTTKEVMSLNLNIIMDHRISKHKQLIASFRKIDMVTVNPETENILVFYGPKFSFMSGKTINQYTMEDPISTGGTTSLCLLSCFV